MKKILPLSLFLLSFAAPGMAQETPAWEFFAGYSMEKADLREYFKSSAILYTSRNQYESLNGWNVSVMENQSRWFGGTMDISGHYRTLNVRGTTNRERRYAILYGPRFSYRTSGVVLFAHTLVGLAHGSVRVVPVGPHDSSFSFAMAAGGGLDVKLGKRAAIRLFKADYFWANLLETGHSGFRASTGVVFYLGKDD